MFGAETTKPLRQASFAKVRPAAHHQASGFAACMRVDDPHSLSLACVHRNRVPLRPGIGNDVIDCTNFAWLCGIGKRIVLPELGQSKVGLRNWARGAYCMPSPVGPKLTPAMGLPEARLARIADRLGPASSIAANTQPSALSSRVLSGKRNIHGIFVDVSA